MSQTPALPTLLSKVFGARGRRQNAVLNNVVRDAKIDIVNLHDDGKLVYARDQKLYASDLFHPSAKGYANWAKLFVEQLRSEKIVSEK
jgi:lysophospholipase L1-like esterase